MVDTISNAGRNAMIEAFGGYIAGGDMDFCTSADAVIGSWGPMDAPPGTSTNGVLTVDSTGFTFETGVGGGTVDHIKVLTSAAATACILRHPDDFIMDTYVLIETDVVEPAVDPTFTMPAGTAP